MVIPAIDKKKKPELASQISRDGSKIYKLDKNGSKLGEINLSGPGGQSLAWADQYFWVGGEKLYKYDMNGNIVGQIYAAAVGNWALTWDGKYLWTIQRTCEGWNDPKIYKIEIKNDGILK
ncbi:hypothetical protein [Pelotomaculum propionicicum]|uniref:Uncharacterized protein n=1 Tax=Pelotomaculum propionicicum TaxID=258475 RepID=A0A4Y7RL15_9FIRM|nr:hypothetical protein [Pelotomaculum propionicicum]TEB09382.1 hypothetical protein Pmgp_03203 [Pelotomaculum propionicicum]